MTSVDLHSDANIQTIYQEIINGETPTNWMLLKYTPNTRDVLHLAFHGSGGVDDLRDHLVDDILFAIVRLNGSTVLIHYVPQYISGVKRARALVHGRQVTTALKCNTTFSAASILDFDEEVILGRISGGPGTPATSAPKPQAVRAEEPKTTASPMTVPPANAVPIAVGPAFEDVGTRTDRKGPSVYSMILSNSEYTNDHESVPSPEMLNNYPSPAIEDKPTIKQDNISLIKQESESSLHSSPRGSIKDSPDHSARGSFQDSQKYSEERAEPAPPVIQPNIREREEQRRRQEAAEIKRSMELLVTREREEKINQRYQAEVSTKNAIMASLPSKGLVFEGFLDHMPPNSHFWARKYCTIEVTPSNRTLVLYDDAPRMPVRARLELKGGRVTEVSEELALPNTLQLPISDDEPHYFHIEGRGGFVTLWACLEKALKA